MVKTMKNLQTQIEKNPGVTSSISSGPDHVSLKIVIRRCIKGRTKIVGEIVVAIGRFTEDGFTTDPNADISSRTKLDLGPLDETTAIIMATIAQDENLWS